MTYQEQLQDLRWYEKREEIKFRDLNKCVKCGSRFKLQVHHKYYQNGLLAWEYPDECYETLCECCHQKEHDETKIKVKKKQKLTKEELAKKLTELHKLVKLHENLFFIKDDKIKLKKLRFKSDSFETDQVFQIKVLKEQQDLRNKLQKDYNVVEVKFVDRKNK